MARTCVQMDQGVACPECWVRSRSFSPRDKVTHAHVGFAHCPSAGAVTHQAINEWLEYLDDTDLGVLRLTRNPVLSTLWCPLTRVDSIAVMGELTTCVDVGLSVRGKVGQPPCSLSFAACSGRRFRSGTTLATTAMGAPRSGPARPRSWPCPVGCRPPDSPGGVPHS